MGDIPMPPKGALLKEIVPIVEELVIFANAWKNAKITPTGVGDIKQAQGNVSFSFNTEKCKT